MNPLDPLTRLLPASLRSLWPAPQAHSEQNVRLARILKIDVAELVAVRMGARYHYRPFTLAKPDGRKRRLVAPSPELKKLQRRLYDEYLAQLPIHAAAMAFRPGCSIVHNARSHARQTLIATVDLRDFFESTGAARVRTFFVKQGWRDEALQVLMRLCVYCNGLPQGAPTSPCLSNLVNVVLDDRLSRLAQRAGAVFTRYCDDLTFSWSSECMPAGFQRAVEDCLHAAGYEIQPCKGWHVSHISQHPCVTGLVLTGNGHVRVPWAWRLRAWRLWLKSWWSADAADLARLQGYQGLMGMVR